MIIPSIDLMNGKAVKLVNGKEKSVESDAIRLAKEFSIYPQINLIDLDGAFGTGDNIELIKRICRICSCNVGGGIRTVEQAYSMLRIGAKKIIIGTNANEEFLKKLPKEKVIVAVDSRKGMVVDSGWLNSTDKTPFEIVKKLENYCSGFLYTYVDKEGTMEDIDLATILKIRKITKKRLYYAGGISDIRQIKQLQGYGIDAVIGMAYYKNKVNLDESFAECIDFSKGLTPTIVKDSSNNILMLAYSSKESLMKAMKDRKGIYFSRRRGMLWEKGETSGNMQRLLRIDTDCDYDSLIFTVEQKNFACHSGEYSCFDEEKFSLARLLKIIESKKDADSFTGKVLRNRKMLYSKILEEADEVVNFKDKGNLEWEISDLLYFILMLMAENKITVEDIEKELEMRNLMKTYIKTTKLSEFK